MWEGNSCVSNGDPIGGISKGPGNGDDEGCFGSPGVIPVAQAPLGNWMMGYGIGVLWEWACGVAQGGNEVLVGCGNGLDEGGVPGVQVGGVGVGEVVVDV